MKSLLNISLAFSNVRRRLFHTFLSILGIVIGVAALVGTLSLIDGMEVFAKKQISANTSIQSIVASTPTTRLVNGIRLKKDSHPVIDHASFGRWVNGRSDVQRAMLLSTASGEVSLLAKEDTVTTASLLLGAGRWGEGLEEEAAEFHGRTLTGEEIANRSMRCMINERLARLLADDRKPEALLGMDINTPVGKLELIGIEKAENEKDPPRLVFPLTLLSGQDLRNRPPIATVEAKEVSGVNGLKEDLSAWLQDHYRAQEEDFRIQTSAFWVEQAEKGFLLFRVVMGMIVGLSVLVGGIGVMNVMVITVKERTSEIGICKAMGAKRRDIFLQFLSESIAISSLGSLLGLVLGILATMAFVPIIKAIADVPFEAAYTLNTLLVIGLIALLVGVIFGTYPALSASRLDPVEAIGRE